MKKGFTLIELLAVIVILAIISLIAVPILINIINDSKKESLQRSIDLYMDTVEQAIHKKQLSSPNFNPSTCSIQSNGDLLCGTETIEVDVKGTKPTNGTITISNNKYYYRGILLNEKVYSNIITLLDDADDNKAVSIGDKYSYKVNATDIFNFYVLSIENNKVNLIMDRNICNDGSITYTSANDYCRYKWYSAENNNTYGPVTAMQELYAGTKDWTNVPDMIMNYTDENNMSSEENGYTGITTSNGITTITGKPTTNTTTIGTKSLPLKTRLPIQTEVTPLCPNKYGSCPVWLMEHVHYYDYPEGKYSINNNSESYQNILGYWLLDTVRNKNEMAKGIFYYGRVDSEDPTTYSKFGIRAVITVPISDLSS